MIQERRHGPRVVPLKVVGKPTNARLRLAAGWRRIDVAEQRLRCRLHPLGKFVEHVEHLMTPAQLVSRLRIHFVHGGPQPQAAIADEQTNHLEDAAVQVSQHIPPALARFPVLFDHREQFFLAVDGDANNDQDRRLLVPRPSLQI